MAVHDFGASISARNFTNGGRACGMALIGKVWPQTAAVAANGTSRDSRAPCSVLKSILADYAKAALMCGERVQMFVPRNDWFRRWEQDYGFEMKKANRKYQVPRCIQQRAPRNRMDESSQDSNAGDIDAQI